MTTSTYNNNLLLRIAQLCCVIFTVILLAACVTTETGGFSKKADSDKALEASISLARQYISEKEWSQAKRHLKRALEIDNESAEVHEAMALVFQNTGELERAEDHYKQAVNYDGSISRIRLNYAGFLMRLQRCEEAVDELERVVADTLYDNRQQAYVSLGYCYRILGNLEKTESSLKRAFLMSNRQNPSLMFELADVYYKLGQYDNAQRYYDGFRAQIKQQPPRALLLGARLAKVFSNDNALSSYGLALKNLYPNSPQYLDYRKEFSQ